MTGRQLFIAAFVLVDIAVLGVIVAPLVLLPEQVHVERFTHVNAPPCNVHAVVNRLSGFNAWSPWAEIDPTGTTYTFSGPPSGVDSSMAWASEHERVGKGRMTITATEPCSTVSMKIEFAGEGDADVLLRIVPDGDGSRVTWGFDVHMGNNPIGRVVGTQMDGMVGPDFARGLENLARVVDAMPHADIDGFAVEDIALTPRQVVVLHTVAPKDPAAVQSALSTAFATLTAAGVMSADAPRAVLVDMGSQWGLDAQFPYDAPYVPPADSPITVQMTPDGLAVRATHAGPYATIGETHAKLSSYLAAHGRQPRLLRWEEYVGDAETRIYQPIDAPPAASGGAPPAGGQ